MNRAITIIVVVCATVFLQVYGVVEFSNPGLAEDVKSVFSPFCKNASQLCQYFDLYDNFQSFTYAADKLIYYKLSEEHQVVNLVVTVEGEPPVNCTEISLYSWSASSRNLNNPVPDHVIHGLQMNNTSCLMSWDRRFFTPFDIHEYSVSSNSYVLVDVQMPRTYVVTELLHTVVKTTVPTTAYLPYNFYLTQTLYSSDVLDIVFSFSSNPQINCGIMPVSVKFDLDPTGERCDVELNASPVMNFPGSYVAQMTRLHVAQCGTNGGINNPSKFELSIRVSAVLDSDCLDKLEADADGFKRPFPLEATTMSATVYMDTSVNVGSGNMEIVHSSNTYNGLKILNQDYFTLLEPCEGRISSMSGLKIEQHYTYTFNKLYVEDAMATPSATSTLNGQPIVTLLTNNCVHQNPSSIGELAIYNCVATYTVVDTCLHMVSVNGYNSCMFDFIGEFDSYIDLSYKVANKTTFFNIQRVKAPRFLPAKTFTQCNEPVPVSDAVTSQDIGVSHIVNEYKEVVLSAEMLNVDSDNTVAILIEDVNVVAIGSDNEVVVQRYNVVDKRLQMYNTDSKYWDNAFFCRYMNTTGSCQVPFFLSVSHQNSFSSLSGNYMRWNSPGRGYYSCQDAKNSRAIDRFIFKPPVIAASMNMQLNISMVVRLSATCLPIPAAPDSNRRILTEDAGAGTDTSVEKFITINITQNVVSSSSTSNKKEDYYEMVGEYVGKHIEWAYMFAVVLGVFVLLFSCVCFRVLRFSSDGTRFRGDYYPVASSTL